MNIKNKKILVTGGCGYVGSVLVQNLLKKNYKVVVVDKQWFGNYLKEDGNLKVINCDIRQLEKINFQDIQTVIHLAGVANDLGVELNPALSWEINVLATHEIMEKIINESDVKQIIFASSGSVYGVKEEEKVTENLRLLPISVYNKTKMVAEKVLLNYKDKLKVQCIRPATVCGFSPRMRLDVAVNMLTFQALKNKEINVNGGNQIRPNIHINDLSDAFIHLIENENINGGLYNAGFENLSIKEIAEKIRNKIDSKINIMPLVDPRSYRLNSEKLIKTGFKNNFNVDNAIDEIIEKYNNKELIEHDSFYTVKWMKHLTTEKLL